MHTFASAVSRLGVLGAAGLLVLGAAGCSSDSDTAQPASSSSAVETTTAPAAGVCTDVDAARTSFQELTDTEILKEGTNTFRERYAAFQTSVDALLVSAQAEFSDEVDAVKASLTQLQTAVGGLTDSPSLADAAAVKDALTPVGDSLANLTDAVSAAC